MMGRSEHPEPLGQNVKVTSVLDKQHEHAIVDDNATLDEQTLGALGYK